MLKVCTLEKMLLVTFIQNQKGCYPADNYCLSFI